MTHVISGCGPGIPRTADTPQHGIRSVSPSPDPNELRTLVLQAQQLATTPGMTAARYLTLSAMLQRAADLARKIGSR